MAGVTVSSPPPLALAQRVAMSQIKCCFLRNAYYRSPNNTNKEAVLKQETIDALRKLHFLMGCLNTYLPLPVARRLQDAYATERRRLLVPGEAPDHTFTIVEESLRLMGYNPAHVARLAGASKWCIPASWRNHDPHVAMGASYLRAREKQRRKHARRNRL